MVVIPGMNSVSNNINFTARCPQVRDAQWVCHVVNTAFPHVSSTRLSAPMYKLKSENENLYNRFVSKNILGVYIPYNYDELKLLSLFKWQKRLVDKLNSVRKDWQTGIHKSSKLVDNVINQLKFDKLGNCGEDALLSEAILKINGVKNSYTANLITDNSKIDHSVCVFNRDGSKFDGKVTKNTIIIDPWIGAADFAQNMFLKYKSLANKYFFNIDDKSKLGLTNIKSLKLSGKDTFLLALKHGKLVYPGVTREFMQ